MSEKSFRKSEFKRTIDLGKTDRGQDTDLIRVWRESSGEEKAISLGDINAGLIGDYVPYTGAVDDVDLGEKGISAGYVKYDTTPTSTPTDQGTTYWDIDDNTLAVIMNGTTLKVGEDQYYPVKNQTGVLIPKGTAVRFAGTLGSSGRLLIAPFIADGSVPSSRFMGVTSEDIANGADGKVMWFGRIRGLNTNSFNEGDILYASTTVAGGFQTTVPEAPNNIIQVCAVINKSTTQGIIFVRPTLGSNINKDEGVKLTSLADKDLLQYQSATGLWENKNVASIVELGAGLSYDVNGKIQLGKEPYPEGRVIDLSEWGVAGNSDFVITNSIANGDNESFFNVWRYPQQNGFLYYTYKGDYISRLFMDSTKNGSDESASFRFSLLSPLGDMGLFLRNSNFTDGLGEAYAYFSDSRNNKGLVYDADYSAVGTLDNRWIPDWGAVTGAIASAGHSPVTIGSPANGLSIDGSQVLTIGLASTSTTGALSSTDWNTFNAKIGGSLTSGRVPFATGVNTLGDDAGLQWDNSTKVLTAIGQQVFQGTTATDTAPLGTELATTGSGTNWTGTSFATGYTHTVGSTAALTTSIAAVIGTYYQIAYTITGRTAGSITINYGGTSTSGITATGATGPVATSTANLEIVPTSDFNGTVVLSLRSIGISSATTSFANSSSIPNAEIRASNITSNLFYGRGVGSRNTTGFNNIFFGVNCGRNNTTGSFNAAFGLSSFEFNTTGSGNSVFGANAGELITTGGSNALFGRGAGGAMTSAITNSSFGTFSSLNITTSSNGVFLGFNAGRFTSTGSNLTLANNSIFLGVDTRANANSETNQIVIGHNAIGLGSSTTVIGNSSTNFGRWWGNLLLGTSVNSGDRLRVDGTVRLDSVTSATGDIVTIDANNILRRQTIAQIKTSLGVQSATSNGAYNGSGSYIAHSGSGGTTYFNLYNLVYAYYTSSYKINNIHQWTVRGEITFASSYPTFVFTTGTNQTNSVNFLGVTGGSYRYEIDVITVIRNNTTLKVTMTVKLFSDTNVWQRVATFDRTVTNMATTQLDAMVQCQFSASNSLNFINTHKLIVIESNSLISDNYLNG